jgi:hypothetical protein
LAMEKGYGAARGPEVPLNLVMGSETGYRHELWPPPGKGDLRDEVEASRGGAPSPVAKTW